MTNKELLVRVKKILWEKWDPIGTRVLGGPDDEYDWYVPHITSLLRSGAHEATTARKLMYWALVRIGMPLSMRLTRNTLRAAKALATLPVKL